MRKCLPTALNIGHSIESSVRQAALFPSLVTPCLDFQVYCTYIYILNRNWIDGEQIIPRRGRFAGATEVFPILKPPSSNPPRGWDSSWREEMIGYCKFDVILGLKLRRGLRGDWNSWENRVLLFPSFSFYGPSWCWRTSSDGAEHHSLETILFRISFFFQVFCRLYWEAYWYSFLILINVN